MKRISYSIFLVVAFVLLCSAQPSVALHQEKEVAGLANLLPSNEKEWSEEESEEIAAHFLRNSPTFADRGGIEDSLTLLNATLLEQPYFWQFDYEFECEFSGYGYLIVSGPIPIETIPHRAEIVVQEGKVISAVLDNEWDILAAISLGTRSPSTHLLEGNWVDVDFRETCSHSVFGDSFTNAEVTAMRMWRISHISNTADETGEPVRGLKVALDSDVAFDGVVGFGTSLIRKGPPTYELFYDELVEEPKFKGHPFDAAVLLIHGDKATFTPGFDVSRSFDKTVFTTSDTQTVTVTFTKREETFERVLISVGTEADSDLIDTVIVAHSDEWYNEHQSDEHYAEFGITKRGIPVELNIPLTVTVTIQVTPKVPEVWYKPHIHVSPSYLGEKTDSDTVEGSSFSYINEAGTWMVSADGNYVWNWSASAGSLPSGSVDLLPSRDTRSASKMSWSVIYGIVAAGILIIGLTTFFLLRRRRGRAA
ncbi:hypothetical protein ACFLX5_05620 [Chloroflexota bacterium]